MNSFLPSFPPSLPSPIYSFITPRVYRTLHPTFLVSSSLFCSSSITHSGFDSLHHNQRVPTTRVWSLVRAVVVMLHHALATFFPHSLIIPHHNFLPVLLPLPPTIPFIYLLLLLLLLRAKFGRRPCACILSIMIMHPRLTIAYHPHLSTCPCP